MFARRILTASNSIIKGILKFVHFKILKWFYASNLSEIESRTNPYIIIVLDKLVTTVLNSIGYVYSGILYKLVQNLFMSFLEVIQLVNKMICLNYYTELYKNLYNCFYKMTLLYLVKSDFSRLVVQDEYLYKDRTTIWRYFSSLMLTVTTFIGILEFRDLLIIMCDSKIYIRLPPATLLYYIWHVFLI